MATQSRQTEKEQSSGRDGNQNSDQTSDRSGQTEGRTQSSDLRDSPMMAHLLDALERGTDVGHYGRLTFTMIARHFMGEDELVKLLAKQPDHDEEDARTLLRQVEARDYNPPKRERILQWQSQQEFAICPTPDDPSTCNVYSDLRFPDDIYNNIEEFYEEQAEGQHAEEAGSANRK